MSGIGRSVHKVPTVRGPGYRMLPSGCHEQRLFGTGSVDLLLIKPCVTSPIRREHNAGPVWRPQRAKSAAGLNVNRDPVPVAASIVQISDVTFVLPIPNWGDGRGSNSASATRL